MHQVNDFERMLIEDGIILVKFWFSIQMAEQSQRIQRRLDSPLVRWKVSPVDLAAQEKWEDFSRYKNTMFEHSHTELCPWMIVQGSDREDGRINAMRYVLSLINYEDKSPGLLPADEQKVFKWRPYE